MRICFSILILLLPYSLYAESLPGRVVRIIDGDTLVVQDSSKIQHKINLKGIDAPEHNQANGKKSKEYLIDLVSGRFVVVDYSERNRYNRIIGKVLLNNQDMNLELIEAGLAWHYKKQQGYQSETDRQLYDQAENEARINKRGLWFDPDPIPPWEFRKK